MLMRLERSSRRSKSFADVAQSKIGFNHRSSREVKVLRMLEAVTGARSITSQSARTHSGDSGYLPLPRPSISRFQWAPNPSSSEAMPCRRISPIVRGSPGVSNT